MTPTLVFDYIASVALGLAVGVTLIGVAMAIAISVIGLAINDVAEEAAKELEK